MSYAMRRRHKTEAIVLQPAPLWGTWAKPLVNSNCLSLSLSLSLSLIIEETYQNTLIYLYTFFQGGDLSAGRTAPLLWKIAGAGIWPLRGTA
jgi:hypothetical protein